MAEKVFYATGRRKTSVARVYLKEGKGSVLINDQTLEDYFGRETARMIVLQPFQVTHTQGNFDTKVNVQGGGISGQAGAIRHGRWRHLRSGRCDPSRDYPRPHPNQPRFSFPTKKGWFRHPRSACG